MKLVVRIGLIVLLGAVPVLARTVHQLELRGDARILSMDTPVRSGRVLLFHRYPDGVLLSVPAADVLGVSKTNVPTNVDGLRQTETIFLGPTGEGHPIDSAAPPVAPVSDPGMSFDYGYADYGYGCCAPAPGPPRPGPLPPALVGPNGYPMAPGTKPLPIGSNGFPILAPTPLPR
jgi:hypothetical protein